MRMGPGEKVEAQRAAVIRFCYWAITALCLYGAFKYLLPTLLPFVVAYLMAWVLDRPISLLSVRWRVARGVAATVGILACSLLIIGLMVLLGAILFSGVRDLAGVLPRIFNEGVLPGLSWLFRTLEQLAANIDPEAGATLQKAMDSALGLLSEGAVQAGTILLTTLGGVLTLIPALLMKTIVTIIAGIFIAVDFSRVQRFLLRLLPRNSKAVLREAGSFFGHTVPRCLAAYLLIFGLTFCELSLGFWLLGISGPVMLGLLVAVLDILPVLGTGAVLLPWAVMSLLGGRLGTGVGLLILYIAITAIRNMVEPRLVGSQIRLHPVLTFAGMLVGLHFLGLAGLFGVPLLLAFLRQLHENGVIVLRVLEEDEA